MNKTKEQGTAAISESFSQIKINQAWSNHHSGQTRKGAFETVVSHFAARSSELFRDQLLLYVSHEEKKYINVSRLLEPQGQLSFFFVCFTSVYQVVLTGTIAGHAAEQNLRTTARPQLLPRGHCTSKFAR